MILVESFLYTSAGLLAALGLWFGLLAWMRHTDRNARPK
jgi:hypothetical protein